MNSCHATRIELESAYQENKRVRQIPVANTLRHELITNWTTTKIAPFNFPFIRLSLRVKRGRLKYVVCEILSQIVVEHTGTKGILTVLQSGLELLGYTSEIHTGSANLSECPLQRE
eukprot:gene27354-biopygen10111